MAVFEKAPGVSGEWIDSWLTWRTMFSAASPDSGMEKHVSQDFTCPHCGADVPSDALACPECGSDQETGWSEAAAYDDLLLYDSDPPADSSRHTAWPGYLIAMAAALTLSAYLATMLAWGVYLIPVVLAVVGGILTLTQALPRRHHSQEKQV